MGKIILEDIIFYSNHGHFKEEQKIGGKFIVNAELDAAFEDAMISDQLNDTFDYQLAYNIIRDEMSHPSALIENLAGRIADRLLSASPLVWGVKIKVSKMSPPLEGSIKAVSVVVKKEREQ